MKEITENSCEPCRKRPKIDQDTRSSNNSNTKSCDQISINSTREVTNSSQSVTDSGNVIRELLNNSMKMLELEQELYTMTGEILESMEKRKDAVHYNRLATQIQNIKGNVNIN